MNRRNFLSLFSAGVAGIALEQAIPLGRVWSFPKEIMIAKTPFEDFVFNKLNIGVHEWQRELMRDWSKNEYSYAAIRARGWHFPTAAFPPDSSRTPS
jgi:hypothetical protein